MLILLGCVLSAIAVFAAVAFYGLWHAIDTAEKYHAE